MSFINENKQWDEVKQNYLADIKKALSQSDCGDSQEILQNVYEHLDQKYNELSPNQQTWENYLKIIADMGPAADYVNLLDLPELPKKQSTLKQILACIFVITFIFVAFNLFISAKENSLTTKTTTAAATLAAGLPINPNFINDPEVLGKWVSVDFVKEIKDFNPTQRNWKGQLYLKYLAFEKGGKVNSKYAKSKKECPGQWTKGKVKNGKWPAKYLIKEINGQKYLFFAWMSGDVTIRGMKPKYYVLKAMTKSSAGFKTKSDFQNDPEALGKWVFADFVTEIDDFNPALKKWRGGLYLENVVFKNNGQLNVKSVKHEQSIPHSWTKGQIQIGDAPGKYQIKEFDGQKYLFFEWMSGDVTIRGMKPKYYVMKKS